MVKKNQRPKSPPFVMVEKDMLKSQEWKYLSHTTKLIYIHLKSKYNGKNPDSLSLPYSEIKDQFSSKTISKALKELIDNKWVEKTKHGGLFRFYCTYKLIGRWGRLY